VHIAENVQTYFAALPNGRGAAFSSFRGQGILQIVGHTRVYPKVVSAGKGSQTIKKEKTMNTLQSSYQAVIEHIAAEMETLKQNGQIGDTVSLKLLQKRCEWLACRKNRFIENRVRVISGFKVRLDAYLYQCESFWQNQHERTYEKKLKQLHEAKRRVVAIYSLTEWDACYALMLTLKHLRAILPLPQYPEYAPALAALEAIKEDCYQQLATYIKV
jgi:hypothetical protein